MARGCDPRRSGFDSRTLPVAYKNPDEQRDYQRKWIAARRAEYFDGKFCVQCGSAKDLELDHVDPNLKLDHKIWSWTEERRNREIAKCQVLCAECHLARSNDQRVVTVHDGKTLVFYRRGCRCDNCRLAKAVEKSRYLERKKLNI